MLKPSRLKLQNFAECSDMFSTYRAVQVRGEFHLNETRRISIPKIKAANSIRQLIWSNSLASGTQKVNQISNIGKILTFFFFCLTRPVVTASGASRGGSRSAAASSSSSPCNLILSEN